MLLDIGPLLLSWAISNQNCIVVQSADKHLPLLEAAQRTIKWEWKGSVGNGNMWRQRQHEERRGTYLARKGSVGRGKTLNMRGKAVWGRRGNGSTGEEQAAQRLS